MEKASRRGHPTQHVVLCCGMCRARADRPQLVGSPAGCMERHATCRRQHQQAKEGQSNSCRTAKHVLRFKRWMAQWPAVGQRPGAHWGGLVIAQAAAHPGAGWVRQHHSPMWSRWPWVISTVCWNTDACGQRPMSRAILHLGSIKHVSCGRHHTRNWTQLPARLCWCITHPECAPVLDAVPHLACYRHAADVKAAQMQ